MYIFLLIFVKGCYNLGASLVAQGKTKRKRKIFLQMKEMWIQSLDQEDLWEEEIATHSNSLLWAIPWTEEPGGLHFSSVQFSHSVVSDSLQPHGLQHSRLPCPSPTPRVYPNSCPLSWWCHPTFSSSVIPSPPTFNQNMVDWRREWQTTLVFLPDNPMNSMKRAIPHGAAKIVRQDSGTKQQQQQS